MDAEIFGAFLQARRKSLGLTQAELAEKLHVTDKAVSRWERGVGFPDIRLLEPLAQALEVSLLELMQSQKLEADTVPKDAADAAVAGTLQIAQRKPRNLRWLLLDLAATSLVAVVAGFFVGVFTWFVDVLWIRSLCVYLACVCACAASIGIRAARERRIDPEGPVRGVGREYLTLGVCAFCVLALILSFPIQTAFGRTACVLTRLAAFVPAAGWGIAGLCRFISSMLHEG